MLNLASLQYDRGETREALANMREVLGIYRKAYPPDHPETARVLNGIGSWLTMGGEDTEADVYLEEGLAMRRRLLNAQHPDIASSLIALSILRVDQKKYTEALDFARNAKSIYTTALSPNHWRTALAECAEGAALTGLGRYSRGRKTSRSRLRHLGQRYRGASWSIEPWRSATSTPCTGAKRCKLPTPRDRMWRRRNITETRGCIRNDQCVSVSVTSEMG